MLKKQIAVFVFCTIISMAAIVAGANSISFAFMMPLILSAVYATEYTQSNKYGLWLNFAINMALSLLVTKNLFVTFCAIPLITLSGVIIGICAAKNYSKYTAILGGIISTGGIYVAYIIYSIKVMGTNPVMEMFFLMENILLSMTTMSETTVDLMYIVDYIAMSKNLFVAIMIIVFAMMGYLVAYFTACVLDFFNEERKLNLTFSEFKSDGITIFVYIVSLLAGLFVKEGVMALTLTNVYLVLNFYLALCGASVVYYLVKHKMKAPFIIKKFLGFVILAISFSGIFSTLLVLLALWDSRRDFRRLNQFEE
jgi:hypothetical protein